MQKVKRLAAIEKIIDGSEITSQEELMKKLKSEGYTVTQATLSRDLHQLGVSKVPGRKGGYVYSLHSNQPKETAAAKSLKISSLLKELIDANGMVILKTIPGHANSVAVTIDNASRYEVAGTIAGDDTLLVIPRDGISLADLHNCLELIIPGMKKQVNRK